MKRFFLTDEPLPEGGLLVSDDAAGAIATFVGVVRDHNEGRPVSRLEYEAYPDLAEKEGERVLSEALGRFPVFNVACVHRYGKLKIGEIAICVQASGAHRAEAFRACEWIVEEVKRRVPIWKKEHYVDGESEWVNVTTGGKPEVTEAAYYSRQDLVADRSKISAASVLVVGAGGLGSPALTYLAGAGVGRLTVIDPDRVEVSNLHRQVLYGVDDLGLPKAASAARRLRNLNPLIEIEPIQGRLSEENVIDLVSRHDLVLDGTDRLATKFLLNRVCVALRKPLVVAIPFHSIPFHSIPFHSIPFHSMIPFHSIPFHSIPFHSIPFHSIPFHSIPFHSIPFHSIPFDDSIRCVYQFEGQLQVIKPEGPCLECLWPTPPEDGCVGTCAETGVLGVTPGMLGTMQATEALKLILGRPTIEGIVTVDLLQTKLETIKLPKRPQCSVCGENADPLAGIATTPLEIDRFDSDSYDAIDIREPDEVAQQASGLPNIPLSNWKTPEHKKSLLLVCASGRRSLALSKRLRSEGVQAFSLARGLAGLTRP